MFNLNFSFTFICKGQVGYSKISNASSSESMDISVIWVVVEEIDVISSSIIELSFSSTNS